MANVKRRVKTSERAPAKAPKQLRTTKKTPTVVNNVVESVTVMKRPSSLTLMTPAEKVQFLVLKGHLVKDKFISEPPLNNGKIDKDLLPITKNSLMSKSGKIRKKRIDNMRLFDNILKSELNIDDSKKKKKCAKKIEPTANNNNDDISDHNVNETISLSVASLDTDVSSNVKKSKSTKKTEKSLPKVAQPLLNPQTVPSVPSENDDISDHNVNEKNSLSVELLDTDISSNARKNKSTKKTEKSLPKVAQPLMNPQTMPSVPSENIFQCDYCNNIFNDKPAIMRHIYGHLNVKPHKCPHCPKRFRYITTMLVHVDKEHCVFLCDICNKTFAKEKHYNAHLTSHVQNDEKFKCLFCDKTFSRYLVLTKHEKQHLVTGRYICSICNMSYQCRDDLSLHLKSHLKIKEFMCQYCGKEFLRLNSMQRHVQVCHVGHRIQCPICKKKLKGHLTEHIRTHDKKRPHKCVDCGQRFTQSTQLNVHRRSHTGARPYPCRICARRFSHSNALMLHIRRHTGEKPFPCAMCPLMFSQLPHMKAHMRNIHGKENAYKCKKCAQFFKLKVHLENHVKNCTVGDRELSFEEKIEASVKYEEVEVESVMTLSRMRYLLALLLTMIASKDKLKYLGFNKRLIDELLLESLEAMDIKPCKNKSLSPFKRLKANIEMLLNGTVPKDQMDKLKNENKSTEEILELLTDEKKTD